MDTDVREKIERYIERTNMEPKRTSTYSMNLNEAFGLSAIAMEDTIEAILLAFNYGQAKGYRAAKAEAGRG